MGLPVMLTYTEIHGQMVGGKRTFSFLAANLMSRAKLHITCMYSTHVVGGLLSESDRPTLCCVFLWTMACSHVTQNNGKHVSVVLGLGLPIRSDRQFGFHDSNKNHKPFSCWHLLLMRVIFFKAWWLWLKKNKCSPHVSSYSNRTV